MGLQLEILSWEVHFIIMNSKVFVLSCLLSCGLGAPAADAKADPQLLAAPLAAPYHAVAASNCVTEHEVLTTQLCTPSIENVCTTETVETEEIEYEKVCKEVVDTICDAPLAPVAPYSHAIYKREAEAEAEAEADAEADPQFLAPYALTHAAAPVVAAAHVAPLALPTAHAVAHSVTATVKHACREVTTEHCVDNPKVKLVPVEVEHCHTVTKVSCSDVENKIPKTICEPVETTHVAHAVAPALGYFGRK